MFLAHSLEACRVGWWRARARGSLDDCQKTSEGTRIALDMPKSTQRGRTLSWATWCGGPLISLTSRRTLKSRAQGSLPASVDCTVAPLSSSLGSKQAA